MNDVVYDTGMIGIDCRDVDEDVERKDSALLTQLHDGIITNLEVDRRLYALRHSNGQP